MSRAAWARRESSRGPCSDRRLDHRELCDSALHRVRSRPRRSLESAAHARFRDACVPTEVRILLCHVSPPWPAERAESESEQKQRERVRHGSGVLDWCLAPRPDRPAIESSQTVAYATISLADLMAGLAYPPGGPADLLGPALALSAAQRMGTTQPVSGSLPRPQEPVQAFGRILAPVPRPTRLAATLAALRREPKLCETYN